MKLFQELDYGRLQSTRPIEIAERTYPISHQWGVTPIHLVGCRVDLDYRTPGVRGAARSSPHSMLQELLNRSDDYLWGFVSNGLVLRVLRDSASLTRPPYVEFDLKAIFDGQVYSDFVLLWLLCHQSRIEGESPSQCWLERWSQLAAEQGARVHDQLRLNVQMAIGALGRGFLSHPANAPLREQLRSGELNKQDYYRQLLRLVYRLIFLFVAEDRESLLDPQSSLVAQERYKKYYSLTRLRALSERRTSTRHHDLYEGLRVILQHLGSDDGCPELGLPALGSFLFTEEVDLDECLIANQDLLEAIRALAFMNDRHGRRPIAYRHLGAEELGGVFEALLELHPNLNIQAATFELLTAAGNERKTSGAYYTPDTLVNYILALTLDPVLDKACKTRDPADAILNLKVIDPACGSGHFLIAAANRMAKRLASVRTGELEPAPEAIRAAKRAVIGQCIYGVDINPMVVELCKVGLWIEALEPGKPLSFLEHHIQVGNSLLGVTPTLLAQGIPDAAFSPLIGDDRNICNELKRRNKEERGGQLSMLDSGGQAWLTAPQTGHCFINISTIPDVDIFGVHQREAEWARCRNRAPYQAAKLAADAWCAAFFKKKDTTSSPPITHDVFLKLTSQRVNTHDLPEVLSDIHFLAKRHGFFHWHLSFPDVFQSRAFEIRDEDNGPGWVGGFDVVLGNPPWERLKLQEQEWFAARDPRIATVNKAVREQLIKSLPQQDYALHLAWQEAQRATEVEGHFIRASGRFPLTAVGDMNTYALFSELALTLLSPGGRAGILVPTGIATDDTTKKFFSTLISQGAIRHLIGFENEAFIFPDVHHSFRFCSLIMTGKAESTKTVDFAFMIREIGRADQLDRHFALTSEEIALLNPNTHTCPVFRSNADAELAKRIYQRFPVLWNEEKENLWGVRFLRMFDMANDSHLFVKQTINSLPLYEAKMIHQFDHRYATYDRSQTVRLNEGVLPQPSPQDKAEPNFAVQPRYWVSSKEVEDRLSGKWDRKWLLGFRDVCRSHDERSAIFCITPRVGVGHKMPLVFLNNGQNVLQIACFYAVANSFIFDYLVRHKLGGASLSYFILKQIPIPLPTEFTESDLLYIVPRVVELTFTSSDIKPFASDIWDEARTVLRTELLNRNIDCNQDRDVVLLSAQERSPLSVFRWNVDRRSLIRAELDARIAKIYRLDRTELRYILDPADVYGSSFPGETFRVLKQKEIKLYGEYRTRRLILEAWDREGY